jgi:hypothetical protein
MSKRTLRSPWGTYTTVVTITPTNDPVANICPNILHSYDDPPRYGDIYHVGHPKVESREPDAAIGRLGSARRERKVEVGPCNTQMHCLCNQMTVEKKHRGREDIYPDSASHTLTTFSPPHINTEFNQTQGLKAYICT